MLTGLATSVAQVSGGEPSSRFKYPSSAPNSPQIQRRMGQVSSRAKLSRRSSMPTALLSKQVAGLEEEQAIPQP